MKTFKTTWECPKCGTINHVEIKTKKITDAIGESSICKKCKIIRFSTEFQMFKFGKMN